MNAAPLPRLGDDEFVAELTDIAYRALLRQGLTRPFVEVELELWSEIRQAYQLPDRSTIRRALAR
jgi:hypothetical protein